MPSFRGKETIWWSLSREQHKLMDETIMLCMAYSFSVRGAGYDNHFRPVSYIAMTRRKSIVISGQVLQLKNANNFTARLAVT